MLNYVWKVVGSRVSEVKLQTYQRSVYANTQSYFLELMSPPQTWLNDVQVTVTNIFKSAVNGLNDVGSRIQEVELPDISETGAVKFIKDLFGGQQHKEGDGESEGSEGERQSNTKPPKIKQWSLPLKVRSHQHGLRPWKVPRTTY